MMRFALGLSLAILIVLGNGLLTWNTTGLSYDRFTWVAYAGTLMYPMTEDEVPGGCTDGEDNDMDGDIDCADEDCANVVPCVAPAPVISPAGLLVLMIVLMLLGSFGILRHRRLES
jgi:hypothetical protein